MPAANQNIYTVTRLNREVRQLLESEMGTVWLQAELSNFVAATSGHWYFTLKDERAQVRCAMFRGNNRRVPFRPGDGQLLLVRARLSLYEPRGDYQLIIESMQAAGDGLLQQQFEQLKFKLAAEGLFSQAHKRPLPQAIRRVGVITSATGAAIHDILTVLKRRNPALEVILYPSQVQGQAAPAQLIHALERANARHEVDLLLLGRGGGSLEDLWCFNDEALARAIHASELPVVSCVGHEVDVTIADFVADLRAPTPSAAAELVSADQRQWLTQLAEHRRRLDNAVNGYLRQQQHRLALLEQRLGHQHPQRRLEQQQQRLDELSNRLRQQLQWQLQQRLRQQERLAGRLWATVPTARITLARAGAASLERRLQRQMERLLEDHGRQLAHLAARLQAVSPLATLSRGYSITLTEQGQLLTDANQVAPGQMITTRLASGELHSRVERIIPRTA